MAKRNPTVTVRLRPETRENLDFLAEATGKTMTRLFRDMIEREYRAAVETMSHEEIVRVRQELAEEG